MVDPQRDAEEDWSLFLSTTERLNAAESMDATLDALLIPAPEPEDAQATLSTIDLDGSGAPQWLTVVGARAGASRVQGPKVGMRFYLPELAFTPVFMRSPGVPLLIPEIASDPRVDERTRSTWAALGTKSVIVLTLALRGRVIGVLTLSWSRLVSFGPREQRVYQALTRHAAVLLENLVMVDRLKVSLAETQKERRLLATMMDNVPVGLMCIETAARKPLLMNSAARRLMAGVDDSGLAARVLRPGTEDPLPEQEYPSVRAMTTREVQRCELDVVPVGGERIAMDVIAAPMEADDGAIDRVVVVMTDVTARNLAAEERTRLQEEVIRAQAAALVERSTPLIPISNDVLAMPLVGTIDRERGQNILEVALTGARERRVRIMLIDVTGVPSIDTRAASVLTQTAHALRLLGVEPVLSGIRPEVAAALVSLDVPIAGIKTCSTLQAGIEYALQRRR